MNTTELEENECRKRMAEKMLTSLRNNEPIPKTNTTKSDHTALPFRLVGKANAKSEWKMALRVAGLKGEYENE